MSYLFGGTPFDGYDAGGRRSLNGGGDGGGSSQPQQVTQTTSNIPDWLQGPTQSMVARGEALSNQPYQAYTGARTAGFTPAQQAAFQQVYGLTEPEQYALSQQSIAGAQEFGAAGAQQAMNFDASMVTPEQLQYFQMANPEAFGTAQAQQYMSPYQQAVTDIAKREALSEASMLNRQLGSQAAKAGAFGGSRFGIEQALLGSKLATNLSDIQTKGLQSAYENAQQQFERDRAAQQAANIQNLQAKLGVQSLGSQQSLAAQQANQNALQQAAALNLQGAQFGANTGLQAGTQLANLGTTMQQQELNRIQALAAAGEQQQAQQQRELDQAYSNYLEQRDWQKNQLGFLSGLIRGTPFSTSTTQSTTQSAPSTTSQLLSTGLGVAGLAALLKKKGGTINKTEGLTAEQKQAMMGEGLSKMGVYKAMGGR